MEIVLESVSDENLVAQQRRHEGSNRLHRMARLLQMLRGNARDERPVVPDVFGGSYVFIQEDVTLPIDETDTSQCRNLSVTAHADHFAVHGDVACLFGGRQGWRRRLHVGGCLLFVLASASPTAAFGAIRLG
jgi:hypothetical protein